MGDEKKYVVEIALLIKTPLEGDSQKGPGALLDIIISSLDATTLVSERAEFHPGVTVRQKGAVARNFVVTLNESVAKDDIGSLYGARYECFKRILADRLGERVTFTSELRPHQEVKPIVYVIEAFKDLASGS